MDKGKKLALVKSDSGSVEATTSTIELVRDLIRDSTNNAHIKLVSEMLQEENTHPMEMYVTRMLIEQWLLAHGYRMIEDRSVSNSIRQQLELQKNLSWTKRVWRAAMNADKQTRTELIQQNEALASENTALMLENASIKAQTAQIALTNQQTLLHATDATSQLLKDAHEQANAIVAISERKTAEALIKLELLEQQIAASKARVTQLQEVEASLMTNPDVVREVYWQNKLEREELERLIAIDLHFFTGWHFTTGSFLTPKDNAIVDEENANDYVHLALLIRIIEKLFSYEAKFGYPERLYLADSFSTDTWSAENNDKFWWHPKFANVVPKHLVVHKYFCHVPEKLEKELAALRKLMQLISLPPQERAAVGTTECMRILISESRFFD